MQLTHATSRPSNILNHTAPRASSSAYAQHGSAQATAEIHAYIAARDMAMIEAEQFLSDLTLNRAFLANDLVESCLQPARGPYQAQCLPEAEALRERGRCTAIKGRIHQLRACAVAAA